MVKTLPAWVPDRQDVVWINCNPQRGREMKDVYPFLVLSPKAFNLKTSLVIGLPMATAAFNATNPFAVVAGTAKGRKAGAVSYILCHQPKSLDWVARGASPHPVGRVSDKVLAKAVSILNQIIQLG